MESIRRSNLEQYTVSDFVTWDREKRLTLNPEFQRRDVWTPDGRTYLIDTMLRGFPMPKIYLRSVIDTRTQVSVRDVVDGQQRLRAILAFARNELRLNRQSEQFKGKTYGDLDESLQQAFLSYPIGVEHLLNATDDYVLEVFSRLNSYTVSLNAAEKRHAKFQSEFKWEIQKLSDYLRPIYAKYGILSTRDMVRMGDDTMTAELMGVVLHGVNNGGAAEIDRLYKKYEKSFPHDEDPVAKIRSVCDWLDAHLYESLSIRALAGSPQFLMLFAAVAHQQYGIPRGSVEAMPPRKGLDTPVNISERLSLLVGALENGETSGSLGSFVFASSRATTRIDSRQPRFLAFSEAVSKR